MSNKSFIKTLEDNGFKVHKNEYDKDFESYSIHYPSDTLVGSYNKTNSTVRPSHGYFKPHAIGNKLEKLSVKFGLKWMQ